MALYMVVNYNKQFGKLSSLVLLGGWLMSATLVYTVSYYRNKPATGVGRVAAAEEDLGSGRPSAGARHPSVLSRKRTSAAIRAMVPRLVAR